MKRGLLVVLASVYVLSLGVLLAATSGQGAPLPTVYSGKVTIDGKPAPEGLELYAKLNNRRTGRAFVKADGTYSGLAVGALDETAANKEITFFASWDSVGGLPEVTATETDRYQLPSSGAPSSKVLNLTFPEVPSKVKPTPTPVPGANTPTPTPTSIAPIPGDASVPTAAFVVLIAGAGVFLTGLGTLGMLRRRGV